ncbi:MAG: hypothetical protein N4A64_02945 [Marinisporobacter sp.]|jgi:hypothetical protein|nr:hypothetical protein [Marinisporobacter sp.]
MKKYYDVIYKIFDLLQTIEDGLVYIQDKMKELKIEEAFQILNDIICGMESIETAMEPLMKKLIENDLEIRIEYFRESLYALTYDYKKNNGNYIMKILEFQVFPCFNRWKTQLENCLRPYVLS